MSSPMEIRKQFLPAFDLAFDLSSPGRTDQSASRQCLCHVEKLKHVRAEGGMNRTEFWLSQLVDGLSDPFSQRHDCPDHMMRLAKWHALEHKIIDEIRGQKCRVAGGSSARNLIHAYV